MKRRDFLLGSAGGLLGATAAQYPALAFERVGDRKMLVFSGGQPVPVLDPHVRYDWSTRMMQQAIYDALAKYQGNPPKVTPWLAESWDTSADGLTWTFHLVGNAKFHNGDPLDAEAVRFSYQRALKLNKGVAWMLKDHLDPEAIEAVDARTVKLTLKAPYGGFLSFIPLWFIVNPKQVTGDDYGQKFLTDGDAGSGPFRINRWDAQAVMALDAVPDYWKGWPMPDADRPAGTIYRVVREPAPRKAALQRGEVDMVTEMTPDDYDQMAKMPGVVVTSNTGMTPFTIQMNTQKGPTADFNLRKALAYAFDYDALLQIENNAAKLMDSPFPNAMTGHVAIADIPRRNLDRAREYLAKTQWKQGGIELEYTYVAGLEVERRIGLALLEISAGAEHQGERGGAALADSGRPRRKAGDRIRHGRCLCHAGQPGCGCDRGAVRLHRGRSVLGHAPSARRRDRRDCVEGAAGNRHHQAHGNVRRHPAAHRRSAAVHLRHAGGPQMGDAAIREGLRVLPGAADRRDRSVRGVRRAGVT